MDGSDLIAIVLAVLSAFFAGVSSIPVFHNWLLRFTLSSKEKEVLSLIYESKDSALFIPGKGMTIPRSGNFVSVDHEHHSLVDKVLAVSERKDLDRLHFRLTDKGRKIAKRLNKH
ncbi:hypothetical protein [Salinivibrio sp. KP-1]|uniref:hypothetical protein n=1 Tax=Salinivibrio sp. KP-1 TaxID=1406902 RepID=UPI0006144EE2|nr:hypothetical protein [Salinivibrio sp. KP-1]KKA45126.1 hypothetical protein WN56_06845 [Salinivibrio sp. KP-1]